uniref:Uncharacterized protein n=1 Tax=Meloidogyne enterolobii TaxID=390850 RepID=A0A6V7TVK3_MELEN|nr:unnamed protein product [Meloidogyne enterolobii]
MHFYSTFFSLFPESPPLTNNNKNPKYKADRADVYSELSDPEGYHPHTQERSKIGTFKNKLWRHPSSISTNNEAYRSHPSTNTSLDRKLIGKQQKQTTTKPYKRSRHFSKNSSKNGGFSGSEFSLSLLAGDDYGGYNNTTSLQRLNKAANRMERMLKEMAGVPTTQKITNHGQPECPFPREDWTNNNKLNNDIDGRYYCHHHHHSMSEYENATNSQRSLAASCCSDFESAIDKDEDDKRLSLSSFFQFNNQKRKSISKLERLRQALILNNDRNWRSNSSRPAANNNKRINIKCDGNEADRSCSPSIGSMQQFSPTTTNNNHERLKTKTAKLLKTLKWRQSVSHSIGYEDEYEIASAPLSSSYASSVSATSWGAENNKNIKLLPSVGENTHFIPIDDDEEDKNNNNEDKINIKEQQLIEDNNSLQKQMLELSR